MSVVFIPEWDSYHDQWCRLGNHSWNVARLIELSRGLEPFDVELRTLNIYYKYKSLSLRQMVMHFRAVNDADPTYPIILDEDGELMDGRHRVMKALLFGVETIKAVRFDTNPTPDKIAD